jgi:uncharacterized protein (DUF1330 family)
MNERVVVIEFDDIAKAVAAHDAAEYQTALKLLGDGADHTHRGGRRINRDCPAIAG